MSWYVRSVARPRYELVEHVGDNPVCAGPFVSREDAEAAVRALESDADTRDALRVVDALKGLLADGLRYRRGR